MTSVRGSADPPPAAPPVFSRSLIPSHPMELPILWSAIATWGSNGQKCCPVLKKQIDDDSRRWPGNFQLSSMARNLNAI
jgi:hypothetical protein